MKINDSEISFVVQGPIITKDNKTQRTLDSIRYFYPNSEIILSTYKNSNFENLSFNKLVLNDDPGAITYNDDILKDKYNNLNRQITTTKSGIKKSTRKYSAKIRTDCYLKNSNLLNIFGQYDKFNDKYKIFNARIIVSSIYTRNPIKVPLLFHISDIFQFGETWDLLKVWDIELVNEPKHTRYLEGKKKPKVYVFNNLNYLFRCSAEQYFIETMLNKNNYKLSLKHPSDISMSKFKLSELILVNNFVVYSNEYTGIEFPKEMKGVDSEGNLLYSHIEWEDLYNKYCLQNRVKLTLMKRYAKVLRCYYNH